MSYKIPLFDLNFDEKEEQAVLDVLKSKWISTGPKSAEFENKFATMLNANHALSTSNCTVSLHMALKLAGIQAGDEVICPSLTFVATANAILYVNAIPVFADIRNLEDLTIDPDDIERKITDKTKAIIVMHYGGFACDMNRIMQIAEKHDLKVVEDACHGPLSEYKGKKLGTIGDIGCFSFFSNKNISTGEGGMVVTNNEDTYNHAKLMRSHGMTTMSYERAKGHSTNYDVVEFGYNYRMDDIRAAIGVVQLDKIQEDLLKRAEIRKWYIESLKHIPEIIIPFQNNDEFTSNYIFPIILKDSYAEKRDIIRDKLAQQGIQTSVHYPAVHRFSVFAPFYKDLPLTDNATNCEITLPMYANLSKEQINYITKTIESII